MNGVVQTLAPTLARRAADTFALALWHLPVWILPTWTATIEQTAFSVAISVAVALALAQLGRSHRP